jgi:hypothetical protein
VKRIVVDYKLRSDIPSGCCRNATLPHDSSEDVGKSPSDV